MRGCRRRRMQVGVGVQARCSMSVPNERAHRSCGGLAATEVDSQAPSRIAKRWYRLRTMRVFATRPRRLVMVKKAEILQEGLLAYPYFLPENIPNSTSV